jgi:hypothetical protein
MKHLREGPPSAGEFILSVMYTSTHYPRRIVVSSKETIADLKQFCALWLHRYVDELDVFIRRDFPYLLHEEHRTLFIHHREASCQHLPLRFIFHETDEKENRRILDLTTLPSAWITHVDRWLHDDPLFHEIRLDGRRQETNEILYVLGEIVRTLPCIRWIRIQGGADSSVIEQDAVAYVRYHLACDVYRTHEVLLLRDNDRI